MTREEISNYIHLQDLFFTDCRRVAVIFSKYRIFTEENCGLSNIQYAESFSIGEDRTVYWTGGYDNQYSGSFKSFYLSLSDSELHKLASEKNRICLERLNLENEKLKNRRDQLEYEKYLELKKKYES